MWRLAFQLHCFNFHHGSLHVCSHRRELKYGDQFQLHETDDDDKSLMINSISPQMAGVYTCEDKDGVRLYSRMQLHVYSE